MFMNNEVSYRQAWREGTLNKRVVQAIDRLASCSFCPRNCGANRLAGEQGFCRTGRKARVASFGAHFGEESPLVGRHGSGTIFFSSCNLLCSFCQNGDISHGMAGREVEPGTLAAMMLSLADQGCHNINFVTPTHVIPQMLEGLLIAASRGLNIPVVYNCGGYESCAALELLAGIVDIYMPDFKFWENRWGTYACGVSDYRDRAGEALRAMHRQVGDLEISEEGMARRGLLVRHLVMPGNAAGTAGVMNFLARDISTRTYVNIMDQYRPCLSAAGDSQIGRRITDEEYRRAIESASEAGLSRFEIPRRLRPSATF